MKILSYLFYIVLAVVVFYISLSNMSVVNVTLVPESIGFLPPISFDLPLFVVMFGSLVLGVILAYFLVFGRAFSASRAKSKADRARRKAEAELEKLKRKTGATEDEVLAILK